MIYERLLIASRLKEARQRLNMTQHEAAKRSYCSLRQLNRIEKGEREITASLLLLFCRLYELEPNDVLGWDSKP